MESLKVTYPTDGLLAPGNLGIDDVKKKTSIKWQSEACIEIYRDSVRPTCSTFYIYKSWKSKR